MGLGSRIFVVGAMLACSGVVSAGEKEDALIAKTVAAYGGEKLVGLQTLRLTDHYRRFLSGQNYSFSEVDVITYRADVFIDFPNQRKEMHFVGGPADDFYAQHHIFDGNVGYFIDHATKSYSVSQGTRFSSSDRNISYRLDTVLAKLLSVATENATYEGEVLYKGNMLQKIRFQPAGYPQLTLYVDKETGLITKMSRPHWLPNTEFVYLYTDHTERDDLMFAADVYVMKGGQPETVTLQREVQMDPDLSNAFQLPNGLSESGKTLSFESMSVKEVSDNVYLAGQGWGFSLFADIGDYFVGMGGYERLKERLAAVQDFVGTKKPLKYQVVTHHHVDHLGGMQEAADLGATFVSVQDHVPAIKARIATEVEDSRFIIIDGHGSVADDAVQLVDVPNGHSSHHLISYIPAARLAFTEDLFYSRQETGAPVGSASLKAYKQAIERHAFDVDRFAAAHSGRLLTKADMEEALNNIPVEVCPADWSICPR